VVSAERDLVAARSDADAKAERLHYWHTEIGREKLLVDEGAASRQEYEDEVAQAAAATADRSAAAQRLSSLAAQLRANRMKAHDAVVAIAQMQAQAVPAAAEAARARAEAQTEATLVGFTQVTAPSAGIVAKRLVDPGVYVGAGTAVARVAVVDRLRIRANVAQRDLADVTVGTPIEATLSDGSIARGRVTSVSPVADPATHTAAVEAIVANTRTDLVPGGFARVTLRIRGASTPHGLAVPSAAIIGASDETAVWTDAGGSAHRVQVRVLSDDGTTATVSGALRPGDRVVVDGAPTLEDGQSIAEERS
jgi:multidrug efflux system membrane fusion protein